LNILRKLKYRLSRTNLDKLYLVYIRPLFEYACELWDNCGIENSQKLEQLQLEAARIVTGLPIFTKTEIVYRDRLGIIICVRRKRRKLQLFFFYNIVNKNTLNYLCTLIPPPYKVRQCIRLEMGMILFYLSVDRLRLVNPVSPPQ
jgi:hypothetical protein